MTQQKLSLELCRRTARDVEKAHVLRGARSAMPFGNVVSNRPRRLAKLGCQTVPLLHRSASLAR
jgi:hypothetical protein